MKNKILIAFTCLFICLSGISFAKGGFSSGGGSRGGFSSSRSAPSYRPSTPSPSYSRPSSPAPQTRSYTSTTVTRSYSYGGSYIRGGGYYGGFGYGYNYNNGLLTGLIIGNMMHPYGTIMYAGPGAYYNNALLYPNGQVVTQNGVLVGTYINGQFTPIDNGQVVAQPVPSDAIQQPQQNVVVRQSDPYIVGKIVGGVILGILMIVLLFVLISA